MVVRVRFDRILLVFLGVSAAGAAPGKFYIVGMGTAPDLITLRGVEVIKSADIILLEQPSEREYWQSFIGNKEVWFCPHGARVGYGLDPKTTQDSDIRTIVENNAKHRKDAVEPDRNDPTEAAGCTIDAGQDGKTEILAKTEVRVEVLWAREPV